MALPNTIDNYIFQWWNFNIDQITWTFCSMTIILQLFVILFIQKSKRFAIQIYWCIFKTKLFHSLLLAYLPVYIFQSQQYSVITVLRVLFYNMIFCLDKHAVYICSIWLGINLSFIHLIENWINLWLSKCYFATHLAES